MRVAIFTGSSDGADQRWHEAATQVTWSAMRLYLASSVRSQTQRGVSSTPSSVSTAAA